ncbi:MAG: HPF/RaiA family ribosome-associated protein [Bacteroidota bacterium]
MQVIINKSGTISDEQVSFIEEKMEKLQTFYDRIERADVHFRTDDRTKEADSITVIARLAIPGNDVAAEYTDPSLEKAVVEVQEKLRRQLIKVKERQSRR